MGVFCSVAGKDNLTIEFKEAVSLKEVVEEIVRKIPNLKRTLIDPDLEDPTPNSLIFVNDKEVSVLNGLETTIREGDEVTFISVLHTG